MYTTPRRGTRRGRLHLAHGSRICPITGAARSARRRRTSSFAWVTRMHEMSLCEGLVQTLEAQATAQHFTKVHKVWLEMGALATIEPEAMRFNFPIVARGTLAEDAELITEIVDGEAWCMQ